MIRPLASWKLGEQFPDRTSATWDARKKISPPRIFMARLKVHCPPWSVPATLFVDHYPTRKILIWYPSRIYTGLSAIYVICYLPVRYPTERHASGQKALRCPVHVMTISPQSFLQYLVRKSMFCGSKRPSSLGHLHHRNYIIQGWYKWRLVNLAAKTGNSPLSTEHRQLRRFA